jgi:hypothetical protein
MTGTNRRDNGEGARAAPATMGIIAMAALLAIACGSPDSRTVEAPRAGENPWQGALLDTLIQHGREDQLGRAALAQAAAGNDTVTLLNTLRGDSARSAWLRTAAAEHGWPNRSRAGDSAAHAAWLILQHSPIVEWQDAMLPLLEQLADSGEVLRSDVATFADRLLVRRGEPQRYGSQFDVVNGRLVAALIAEPAQLDSLRASVGLPPIREYVKMLGEFYGLPVVWPPAR